MLGALPNLLCEVPVLVVLRSVPNGGAGETCSHLRSLVIAPGGTARSRFLERVSFAKMFPTLEFFCFPSFVFEV